MDPALEKVMEPIVVPGSISGADVIDDLCVRIAEKLSLSGDLRTTDAYRNYSATVRIDLQLVDIDPVSISAKVAVGTIDPRQPSRAITVEATMSAEELRERSGAESANLERPIDSTGFTPPKRIYVSRIRAGK